MKLLLDTHTLLWWIEDSPKLSARARKEILKPKNEIYMSVVNIWEIAIKARLKKLDIRLHPRQLLSQIRLHNDFQLISIEAEHAATVYDLPQLHSDPFDRLLISQAKTEKMSVITDDQQFDRYEVSTIF